MSWVSRLKNALNPRRLENDIAEELRDHIERRAADLQAEGLSADEARRRATLAFGSVAQLREESRQIRLWSSLEDTLQDLRYAWRGMLRSPAFAFTAVISLGLAIGANTAIYSILDAALMRPLPLPHPEQLFALTTAESADGSGALFSYPLYVQLRNSQRDSAHLVLLDSANRVPARVVEDEAPYEEVVQQFVSPDYFDVLGVVPAVGRFTSLEEDHYPSPRSVVVLSFDYWRGRFGASSSVVGRRIVIDGRSYSVLGVAREGFHGTEPGKYIDVWTPATLIDPAIFDNSDARLFRLMGRLAPGTNWVQIQQRIQPVFIEHQRTRVGSGLSMPPAIRDRVLAERLVVQAGANGISDFRRTFSRALWMLLTVSAAILLIACSNVASLLLARSAARSAEMALRISLGARRSRVVRQLLTESLFIAVLAGLCGWMVSGFAGPALVRMLSSEVNPVRLDLTPNLNVLLFCITLCAASGILFGFVPAWQATASRPMSGLRHPGGHNSRLHLGRLFVAAQVAFAFCLVTVGSGFVLSLRHLSTVNVGFDPNGLTVLSITNTRNRERQLPLMWELQMRTESLPQVKQTATAWMSVLSGARRSQRLGLPGKPLSEREETFYRVSPNYFATLGTPLLTGRDFTTHDNDNEPVPTIVNRAFASRYFKTESVIGREFRRDDGVRHQIIGLAADSHFGDVRGGAEPIAYMPMKPPRAFTMYVRSSLDAVSLGKMVNAEARKLDPDAGVRETAAMPNIIERTIVREKLLARIGGTFGMLGLVLAAIGLFGLLNYSVTLRTKEIGIRTALGAQRTPIYRIIFKDLTAVVTGGVVAGLGASFVLLNLAQSLLYGIAPADPAVIGLSMIVFLSAGLLACWLPARRATSIDSMVALRHE